MNKADILNQRLEDSGFEIGKLQNGRKGVLRKKGGPEIKLGSNEMRICELLIIQNPFEMFSREDILNSMYVADRPEKKIIDVTICYVRKKIETLGIDSIGITTKYCRGYYGNIGSVTPEIIDQKIEISPGVYFFTDLDMVWTPSSSVSLAKTESELFQKLLYSSGTLVDSEIFSSYGNSNTIRVFISLITKKLRQVDLSLGQRMRYNKKLGHYWQ